MDLSLGFVTWICLNLNWLLAVTGVMHEADDAYSIRSTWSCYWLDQFLTLALNILILSIFYISMDLSTNYFAHFSGCWASFACSCHYPRMLCHVFWSQVEYKIVCFIYPVGVLHHYNFIIYQLWLTSHPRSTVVLLDTLTPGTSREIFSENADDGTRTRDTSITNWLL